MQTEKIDIEKIPNVPRVPFLILKCSTRRVETMNIVLGTNCKYSILYKNYLKSALKLIFIVPIED